MMEAMQRQRVATAPDPRSWSHCAAGIVRALLCPGRPSAVLFFALAALFLIKLPASCEARVQLNNAAGETKYAFEVVSIRPSANEGLSHWRVRADGYFATNVTAQQLIFDAYQTEEPEAFNRIISLNQIRGMPKWADVQQFDVTAKVDEQTMSRLSSLSATERKRLYETMLQPVLRERFHMAAHHEKQEQSVYLLKVAQGGSKMTESNIPFEKSSLTVGRSQIHARGMKLDSLVETLTQSQGRIVVDQTRLTGVYDFDLKWSPQTQTETSNDNLPLTTAVKEQLGLELVPSKGPVDSIMVTRLDSPSPN